MRSIYFIALLAPAIGALPQEAAGQSRFFTIERNIDRPGRDFRNTPAGSAADCSFACQAENQCRAYTFVKPSAQDPFGRCFLKNAVPKFVRNNCCSSGVRKAVPGPID
jgi:PAN domain-containing protein